MAVEKEERNGNKLPTGMISAYELSREKRIRENLDRMQKMGILDLTRNLTASSSSSRVRKKQGSSSSAAKRTRHDGIGSDDGGGILLHTPLRRSSRLQNATPVTYSDILLSERVIKGTKCKRVTSAAVAKTMVLDRGPKPEVYTEEHAKLLGSTERSWEFFVDGYGEDGRRIYDSLKGKTCHQCRQKTLGYRTKCSQCGMVQGQFCGDCLYMRYGEHVLEALENPNWICPVCRGICNCSLCRQAKGWAPTGPIYRKISSMGFKSVAHYLIETHRSQLKLETNAESPAHFSAKRSLPFSELSRLDLPDGDTREIKPFNLDPEVDNSSLTKDGDLACQVSTKRTLNFSDGNNAKDVKSHSGDHGIIAPGISANNNLEQVKKDGCSRELKQDNTGGSIPDRCGSESEQPEVDQESSELQNECPAASPVIKSSKQAKSQNFCSEPNQESIGGRLKLRKRSLGFLLDGNNSTEPVKALADKGNFCTVENSSKELKKHSSCREAAEDSVGGRLRLRKIVMLRE
ncbi:hypothetical protein MLD38_028614 [Melastoma candidum]|uniref:Uncharacterized protein n=1 Tax=Melastoma candidum TaxID=119954 RepID=A0ACB9N5V8_9MYRT|nr:hypothetical protein MLD38_028614 [Melastoma candidum]